MSRWGGDGDGDGGGEGGFLWDLEAGRGEERPHLLGTASRASLLSASVAELRARGNGAAVLLGTSQPTMKSSRAGISQAIWPVMHGAVDPCALSRASAKPAITKTYFLPGKRI